MSIFFLLKSYIKLRLSTSQEVWALRYTGEIRRKAIGVLSDNASEGMVGAILGLSVWHVTALSGVGRQDCPRKRRPVRIRQSKVNRPNVAPMGVTSPRLQSWVVDRITFGVVTPFHAQIFFRPNVISPCFMDFIYLGIDMSNLFLSSGVVL